MSKPGERNQEFYLRLKAELPEKFHDDLDALCDELESDFTTAQDEHEEALAEAIKELESKLETAERERDELQGQLETARGECDEEIDAMESVLTDLKYWFLDVMVHGRPMTDPRKMLRKVEAVL